jgi:NADP-dependent 3-hydroxy acid dehydrogenase YdfG
MSAFAGQVAVVTGATGAVGRAIAERLIACGATTALVGRRRLALDELRVNSGVHGASVSCWPVDLTIESDIDAFAREIGDRYPHINVLVHAAGAIEFGGVEHGSALDFDTQYRVNLRAPYQLTQALLPRLVTCAGHIVFINSSAGISGKAGVSQYAATKHGLRALADSVRDEVNARGVRVTSLFLGRTASNMQAAVHRYQRQEYVPERLLQPDDVASLVVASLQLPRTAEVTDIHVRPMLKS